MRPGKQEWTGEQDLFRARLDQIINMRHELVRLWAAIDWDFIDEELAGAFAENAVDPERGSIPSVPSAARSVGQERPEARMGW